MSVNILNKEIKKAYSSQLTLCPFHHKRSRELFSKKNKKRTLINVLNKKIKKKEKKAIHLKNFFFVLQTKFYRKYENFYYCI